MPDTAKIAYEAYIAGSKSERIAWEDLPEASKQRWDRVAQAVLRA